MEIKEELSVKKGYFFIAMIIAFSLTNASCNRITDYVD